MLKWGPNDTPYRPISSGKGFRVQALLNGTKTAWEGGHFATREEAQEAADKLNAGVSEKELGFTIGSYSDD